MGEQIKVSEILAKREHGFSIEILPPRKNSDSIDRFLESIQSPYLKETITSEDIITFESEKIIIRRDLVLPNPKFVSITYHQPNIQYKWNWRTFWKVGRIIERGRPGTQGITGRLMRDYIVVPHLICGGFTKEDAELELIDLKYLGIKNCLALQGDPGKGKTYFKSRRGGNRYASEFVQQIKNANDGIWLASDYKDRSDFDIGVACYPQKHHAAKSLEADIENLKRKQCAGASYAIAQMEFDAENLLRFRDKTMGQGIHLPIVPGIKVLSNVKQAKRISEMFYITIPEDFCNKMEESNDPLSVSLEYTTKMIHRLNKEGFPHIHIYTMNNSRITKKIIINAYT